MVEDLNDDEIMELCKLSNELNACETTAILNPSKFASCATRLGLREGFAVDLTPARANGTVSRRKRLTMFCGSNRQHREMQRERNVEMTRVNPNPQT